MWEEFRKKHVNTITAIHSSADFERRALELFHFQATLNPVYANFLHLLNVAPHSIQSVADIPFLPIEVFKYHDVKTGVFQPEIVFSSSGTTGQSSSRHIIRDLDVYERAFMSSFYQAYGNPSEYCFLGLLPSYLERSGSSLIWMTERLIQKSRYAQSGFYLNNHAELARTLELNESQSISTILLGVTFGLLDFAEAFPMSLHHTIVMETGGMKGRREELTREEVHEILTRAFHTSVIHSEYGMTELMSQVYSLGDGLFKHPPWMRIVARDTTDPLSSAARSSSGGLNIIDLMNVDSCAFIATSDLGKTFPDGAFRVIGRFDQSDVRGCNLMVT